MLRDRQTDKQTETYTPSSLAVVVSKLERSHLRLHQPVCQTGWSNVKFTEWHVAELVAQHFILWTGTFICDLDLWTWPRY